MSIQASRIKERRRELRMSQDDLGAAIGLTQTQISRYESGDSDPTGDVLAALARALATSSDWLLGLSDSQPDTPIDDLERESIRVLRSKEINRRGAIVEIMKIAQ